MDDGVAKSRPRREETDMSMSSLTIDEVFDCVFPYIHNPSDRRSMSLVCKRWYQLDGFTRKNVSVDNCYSVSPHRLTRRFPHIEALKVKGKPKPRARAFKGDLLPEKWGGYARPWVDEIVVNLRGVKAVHFCRMIVKDDDLVALANARGPKLRELKLHKCSQFSTDGLLHVARSCRNLKVLFLEESRIVDNGGQWLHEIALNNTVLETLNFQLTKLASVDFRDLELISRNCHSLKSVKICDVEIIDLLGFFRSAVALEEFYGGSCNRRPGEYNVVTLPATIHHLGLPKIGRRLIQKVFPLGPKLIKLDLVHASLDTAGLCRLIRECRDLEVLQTRNVIGDSGLEDLAFYCGKLKRLRIEHGANNQGREAMITQFGLQKLAEGCSSLKDLAVYASDITNETLAHLGTCLKKLQNFHLVVLDREETQTDWPLDDGVRALLRGCTRLIRFALYLRPGALTDVGLSYIGKYSSNVKWMSLGHAGETDAGLLELSRGCPRLEKLEMRECCFSEQALAFAVSQLRSLRFLWVQGYMASVGSRDLFYMLRPYWNIELIPARPIVVNQNGEELIDGNQIGMHPAQILAYPSLDGRRTDYPETVTPLLPEPLPV